MWITHRTLLENIIWSNNLNAENALKLIRLSFKGNALHMAQNVEVTEFLRHTTQDSAKQYLEALEKLFISQSGKELSRIKFNQAKQDKGEVLTIWNARCKTLFRLAYPQEARNMDSNVNVKDRFINGLIRTDQKRYILEQRKLNDDLNQLLQLGMMYEAVQLLVNPGGDIPGLDVWKQTIDAEKEREKRM